MDIQGYILEHWMDEMKSDKPVLVIYDKDGIYHDILPLAEEKGIKVIDTTKGYLHARLAASRYWCNELAIDKDLRMIIYRRRPQPTNKRGWIEEPFSAFKNAAAIFPFGPQDDYRYICQEFLPTKSKELDELFNAGNTTFNMFNALLDGAAYPNLEQLTGGKSYVEITVGLLSLSTCEDMSWEQEWSRLAEIQYPNLDANGATLQEIQYKLWMYLLFSEFVFDLPGELPSELKSIAMAPKEMKEKVYRVCDKLRNQLNLREVYVKSAKKICESLQLEDKFSKAKHLGDRVTFSFENAVEYARYIAYLKEGNQGQAHDMLKKNLDDVWYQEDVEVATFWKLAKYALALLDCINKGIRTDCDLVGLLEWYTQQGAEADNAFRRYHTELLGAISCPDAAKALTELVNKAYEGFVIRSVAEYQKRAIEIKNHPTLKNQGCVDEVYPALKEGKKVVFVMVDAFRYEMGKGFCESIESNFPSRVSIVGKISYLPSITRFGMANHLADISMTVCDGKLQPSIEGQIISTPEDRIEYLKQVTNVDVQDIRIEDFTEQSIKEETRLLVVRSCGIDVAGENDKLNGLSAMENEMRKLARVLNICRKQKFDKAVMVADHGFMMLPMFKVGNLIPKPVGSDIILEESRMVAGNLNDSENTLSFTPKQLGADCDVLKFCYAKDFTVFRKGEVYYHEGLSLQENVVPIVTVQLQDNRKRSQFKLELKYKGEKTGTIYTRRPLIDICIAQDDLFADDINIKLQVTDKEGHAIGSPDGKFYNEVTQVLNISSAVTSARQPVMIDEEYNGDTILFTALDAETNATLSSLQINFEND